MKKLLLSFIILTGTVLVSRACDIPVFQSGCVRPNSDGSETVTVLFTNLCSTTSDMNLWVHTGSGMTSSDFLHLSSPTIIADYGADGASFEFTISPSDALVLNNCLTVYAGASDQAPWLLYTPTPFTLCACVTSACYVDDPNPSNPPLVVDLMSSSAGPSSLHLWIDDASYAWGPFYTSGPGSFYFSQFHHYATASGFTASYFNHQCFNAYASDAGMDPLTVNFPPFNDDHWLQTLNICPCPKLPYVIQHGAWIIDQNTNDQNVRVETGHGGINYLWIDGIQNYAQQTDIIKNPNYQEGNGELPYIATFDLTQFAGDNLVMQCQDFHFNNLPVYPYPDNSINLCPPVQGRKSPAGAQSVNTNDANLVKLYPNPASDHATVELNLTAAANVQIDITDATGRKISTIANQKVNAGSRKFDFSTTDLPGGDYFIRAHIGERTVNKLLTVIK